MDYKDYYKTLGVDRKASEKEIKAAFRKLARRYHPDVNPGDAAAETRFKEVNEAHEVLSDEEKRRRYDSLGADWDRWRRTGGQAGDFDWTQWMGGTGARNARRTTASDLRDIFGDSSFSDFFTTVFGGGARGGGGFGGFGSQGSGRGQDARADVEISLAEAAAGATRVLSIDGKHLKVRIPPGAATGTRVRVAGRGEKGSRGAPAGHLYLIVSVAPDPRFERKGSDLHVSVPVDMYSAVLGGEVSVPTLEGELTLKISPGSQNGQTLRVRGRGMPKLRKPKDRGHLYARLEVSLPRKLSPEQRELFQKLQEISQQE